MRRKPWFYRTGPFGLWLVPSLKGLILLLGSVGALLAVGAFAFEAAKEGRTELATVLTLVFLVLFVAAWVLVEVNTERG